MESTSSPPQRPAREFGWRSLIVGLLLATGAAGGFATLQARSHFPVPSTPTPTLTPATPDPPGAITSPTPAPARRTG